MASLINWAIGLTNKPSMSMEDISYSTTDNTSAPLVDPPKQMLPKDLLVHARKFSKEEAGNCIAVALKSNKIGYIPNPIYGSSSTPGNVFTTTGNVYTTTTIGGYFGNATSGSTFTIRNES